MPAILQVTNLVKQYGDFTAVKGISFEIQAGEIFSLLGPNGAGKTTTISILSTLYAPTSGTVQIGGFSVTDAAMKVRSLIGVVPQDLALYEELSARENLFFWGQMYGMGGTTLKKRVQSVLEQINLLDKADKRVKTYSGGMKRRVNIGIGLLHEPKLLFMDEPTVGIDPQSRRAILDTVKALNQQGMTVLYTTHYMEEAAELSHRVGIMDHGQLIALGTQKELTAQVGSNETLIAYIDNSASGADLQKALTNLPEIFAITLSSEATATALHLTTRSATQILAQVVQTANQIGCKIRSLEIREANLESVFLQLTGRALRN